MVIINICLLNNCKKINKRSIFIIKSIYGNNKACLFLLNNYKKRSIQRSILIIKSIYGNNKYLLV